MTTLEGRGTPSKGKLVISCRVLIILHKSFIENFITNWRARLPIISPIKESAPASEAFPNAFMAAKNIISASLN
jgi:hypothetical protein